MFLGCFPFLSFRNAQPTLPCLLRALPAAPPATPGPPLCQEIKCSLKKKQRQPQTKCLWFCFLFPAQHPLVPSLGWEEGRTKWPRSCEERSFWRGRAGRPTLPTAWRKRHQMPPLPVATAKPESQPCPLLRTSRRDTPGVFPWGCMGTVTGQTGGAAVGFGSVPEVTLLKRSLFLF